MSKNYHKVDYDAYRMNAPLRKRRTEPHTVAYSRRPKKNTRVICILVITACLCATLLLADNLSNGFMLSGIADDTKYYAVQTGKYSDKSTAEAYAENVRMRNGAGYVFYDGDYAVLSSVYKTKEQAQSVIDKMHTSGASICEIPLRTDDTSTLSADDKKLFIEANAYYTDVFDTVYTLANEMDLEEKTDVAVKQSLKQLALRLDAYGQKASAMSDCVLKSALVSEIAVTSANVSELCSAVPASSDLRYAITAVIMLKHGGR